MDGVNQLTTSIMYLPTLQIQLETTTLAGLDLEEEVDSYLRWIWQKTL